MYNTVDHMVSFPCLTHPCLSLVQRGCMTLVIPLKIQQIANCKLHSQPFIATEVQQNFGIYRYVL